MKNNKIYIYVGLGSSENYLMVRTVKPQNEQNFLKSAKRRKNLTKI